MFKLVKKPLAVMLSLLMMASVFAGCALADGPIVLDFLMYVSGAHNGAARYQAMVDRFNEKYAGQYEVVIQPIIQDDYDAKVKQLAGVGQMPTLMYSMNDSGWVSDYVANNQLSYDFGPWLEEHPEIKDLLIPQSLEFCTRGGRVYCLPMLTVSPIGLFYNTAVYNPDKAIGDMTLEEFTESLGDLKISFMTAENAWGTMLFFSSLLGAEPGGVELLSQYGLDGYFITDFSDPLWLSAVTKLQEVLQGYAASNTIGAAFADAQNLFVGNVTAAIMNGPWMFGQFDPNNADAVANWSNDFDGTKVKAAIYPNNICVSTDYVLGQYWISEAASDEQKEVALAFIEFVYQPEELELRMLQEGNVCPNYKPSDAFLEAAAENPLLQSYLGSFNENTVYAPRFDMVVYDSVANPGFPNLLPGLIMGTMTPQEFVDELARFSLEAQAQGH